MLKIIGVLILLVPAIAATGLLMAHISIRSVNPQLPEPETVLAFAHGEADLPIRLSILNTARQSSSRSGVLEASLDPDPDAEYTMSYPSFALEWADGRIFLIDLGMDRESAIAFGEPAERLLGSKPIVPLVDVAARLGPARSRVAGVAFTHLHTDHTDGAGVLCSIDSSPISWFSSTNQAERTNYTTRPGRATIEAAGCLTPQPLDGDGLLNIPGFPGLGIIAAGGHTPGSQIFVARVSNSSGDRLWIFTGDLVNHIDGIRHNLPKPTAYSLFIVPEARERLDLLRRYLAGLGSQPDVRLLVSHDLRQLEASGVPEWD
jgi:glyoxylase-like metal-dependent hydrolase (beta-lactamase superfamily II)